MSRRGIKNKVGDYARFTAKIKDMSDPNACWLWIGGCVPKGYGRFWLNGRLHVASIASMILHGKGDLPEGMNCCHSCDNPPCVNPNHLEYGTAQRNTQDMLDRGRHKTPNKLSDKIRAEIINASGSQQSIADRFGIHQSTVSLIKRKE